MFARFAATYLAEEEETDTDRKKDESEDDFDGDDSNSAVSYVSLTHTLACANIHPRESNFVVDAGLIDTGSLTISTIREVLVPAAMVAIVRKVKPEKGFSRRIGGLGSKITAIGQLPFCFFFGGEGYRIGLHIVTGDTPLIISRKDMDEMGLNYQSLYKIIERPSDGYKEQMEWEGMCHI